MDKPKKILISIPIAPYTRIEPELFMWVLKNITHYNFIEPGKYILNIDVVDGKPIDSVRNQAMNRFLDSGNDYVLTIDSDIIPPINCIAELMDHDKPIVGATCFSFQYGYPFAVILDKVNGGYSNVDWQKNKDIRLQECSATGASCVLIKREVIVKMKEHLLKTTGRTMFYESKYNERGEISCGQDFIFCDNAIDIGYKIYVDKNIHCDHKVDRMSLKRVNDLLVEEQNKRNNGNLKIVKNIEHQKKLDEIIERV